MGITKERRLLQMIHQHARINKQCSECLHEGDYMFCSKCNNEHNEWEWKWEQDYWQLRENAENDYIRSKGGARKCRHRKLQRKSAVRGN